MDLFLLDGDDLVFALALAVTGQRDEAKQLTLLVFLVVVVVLAVAAVTVTVVNATEVTT